MIVQFKKTPEPSIDEILEALDLPAPDHGPDSLHLAPGETIRDRYTHHVAKGRAKEAARRRAAFKLI